MFEEGIAIPPVKIYSEGVRNDAVFTIVRRNTRVPEMLSADLDSEIQACLMGARRMAGLFERFGKEQVEACFQAILEKCRDIYRNELLSKIADGEYAWEDYVEHDGITDPKLHKIALKMTKKDGKITLDFNGTDPQSTGPINWPADYADGAFLIKWIAPILRNLADTPERAAEIHVNEGVCDVFEVIFPSQRHADHAGMAGGDQCAVVCAAALSRSARRRGGAGGGRAGCRPTRKPSATPDSSAMIWKASRSCRVRCSAAAPAGAIMPTAAMPSTSCRTRATSPPNSPRPGFRCWWRSWR